MSQTSIVWIIGVLAATIALWLVVQAIFKRVIKRRHTRGHSPSSYPAVQRILKVFVVAVGVLLVSYAFVDKSKYEILNQNILRITWIALIALATIISASVAHTFFRTRVDEMAALEHPDATTYRYLNSLVKVSIYIAGMILAALAIPAARDLATTALTGAGVLALIIGVAAQEAFANLIGGLFIAFFKPFRLGDIIKVAGAVGRVEDLTLRHTVIKNFQNKRIVIPNAIINKETIENYNLTEYKSCEYLEIGISYDSDIDLAMKIMQEEAEAHQCVLDNRSELEKKQGRPIVDVQVIGLGDSSVNLRAWVWAATYVTGFRMRNDLIRQIKQRFDQEGIEIPFPYRTIVMKDQNPPPPPTDHV